MDGNQKGCFAEYHFAATAISLGFNVSTPLLSASYYDCILENVDYFALWDESNDGFFIIPNLGQSCLKLNINGKYKENFNNFALIS